MVKENYGLLQSGFYFLAPVFGSFGYSNIVLTEFLECSNISLTFGRKTEE